MLAMIFRAARGEKGRAVHQEKEMREPRLQTHPLRYLFQLEEVWQITRAFPIVDGKKGAGRLIRL